MTQRPSREDRADDVFVTAGEMSELCRGKDWAGTPLGPVGGWPECLRTTAALVVGAPFPMLLLWGKKHVQIYNDGYRSLMGDRHPAGLGQPTRECWPELWETNAPLYERIVAEGRSYRFQDQRLVLDRNGFPEEAFFEMGLGPVVTTRGAIGGVLVSVFETTAQVLARARERARRARRADLRDSEVRYRALAELSPVANMIIVAGRYEYANRQAALLLGFQDGQELLGRSVFEFILREDQAAVRERMRKVLIEKGVVPSIETRLKRRDGTLVDVEVSSGAVPWGGTHGVQVVIRDITHRKRTEQALRLAKEAAELASRAKSQLLSTMSHELRTPLNAVIGLSDLIESGAVGPVNAVQKDNLARIKTSAWHLVGIIDEILGYSRAETVTEEVHASDVDLAAVVREVVQMLAHDAHARGLSLDVQGADRPEWIHTDETKIRQILTNLIGNALKYTEAGGIEVEMRRGDGVVEVRVRDTGPGIPPDRLEDIFVPFVQVEGPSARAGTGTGLGLAISRRLAALLGGEITVDSSEGEGSTFTLRLSR